MVKVIWTARSLKDLEEIANYISKDSLRYAKLTLEKLIEISNLIEKNPLLGRTVPELKKKDIREIITGNYRVIYLIKSKNVVYILTIHHSSRLISNNPTLRKI